MTFAEWWALNVPGEVRPGYPEARRLEAAWNAAATTERARIRRDLIEGIYLIGGDSAQARAFIAAINRACPEETQP